MLLRPEPTFAQDGGGSFQLRELRLMIKYRWRLLEDAYAAFRRPQPTITGDSKGPGPPGSLQDLPPIESSIIGRLT